MRKSPGRFHPWFLRNPLGEWHSDHPRHDPGWAFTGQPRFRPERAAGDRASGPFARQRRFGGAVPARSLAAHRVGDDAGGLVVEFPDHFLG